jgi:CHAD domain-containing protein
MPDPEIGGMGEEERLLQELRRLLGEVGRGVEEVVGHTHPTPASLHRLHRDLRRLRLGLQLWEALLRRSERALVVPLDRRIQRLARLVGQVRDRDVAVDLLTGVEKAADARDDRERLDAYRARLRDDARTGRELLRALLRSEQEARLFDSVRNVLERRNPRARSGRVRQLLRAQRIELHEKLVKAHRRARRRPSMSRLHRLRIRVRRLRQIADLANTLAPDREGSVTRSMRRLQQDLGHLHDLDVLLLQLDPALRKSRWGRALRVERRELRRAITKTLEATRTKRTRFLDTPDAPAGSARSRSSL